jgi:rRNA maturation RNase YbeY
MINFNYETDFILDNEEAFASWLSNVIVSEDKKEGEINYIFCDDEYLHKINLEYLNHDTLTDIISFDYSMGNELNGDIFVSIERVNDNANDFEVSFENELKRVLVHGLLHYCGYKDKSVEDEALMRSK